jgi:hypothetical protein
MNKNNSTTIATTFYKNSSVGMTGTATATKKNLLTTPIAQRFAC